METQDTGRRLTGWHVFFGFAAAFGVIIAVNVALAVSAVRTFPGLETKNSYVASQTFDADREAQLALGWDVSATVAGQELILDIRDRNGAHVTPAEIDATMGRATHVKSDFVPAFAETPRGFVAPVNLDPGNWNLRLVATADNGTVFRQRIVIEVEDPA